MKQKFHLKQFTYLFVLGFAFLLFSTKSIDAQNQVNNTVSSNTETNYMFVEIKGLDPYTHGDLVKAVRKRSDFSIKSSCVPANIIMFEISKENHNSLDENFEAIKGLTLQVISLSDINLMVGYSEEVFLKKCQEFRKPRR